MRQIKWTLKACGNLQAIHEYIARESKVYATRFIKELVKAVTKLETMPNVGRIVPELETYGFREIVYGNFRIVYRVAKDGNDVEILAVVHAAREFKTAFLKETEAI